MISEPLNYSPLGLQGDVFHDFTTLNTQNNCLNVYTTLHKAGLQHFVANKILNIVLLIWFMVSNGS